MARRISGNLAGLILAVALASCSYSAPVSQAPGLPVLHQLNWGFNYIADAAWSPNGRWIAVLAGDHAASSHLEVVSPDGRFKQDLSSWGCGLTYWFSFAWQPDSTLSCLNGTALIKGAFPFTSSVSISIHPHVTPQDKGLIWSPSGSCFIAASVTAPDNINIERGRLYAVSAQGVVNPAALTPSTADVSLPAWRPHAPQVSYVNASGPNGSQLQLMLNSVARGPDGHLELGPPALLADDIGVGGYTWSPSGRWVVVRHLDAQGTNHLYLINPEETSQTVTVVQADQAILGPVWSPDGQTLIVFSAGYDTATPYELDIGAYLKSKGLQP